MGPGVGRRSSGKTQRTAAHSPAGAPARGMPKQARSMVSAKPRAKGPHIAEQVVQTAANTTLYVDAKNVAVGQMARDQSQQVRSAGRAARRAANVGDSASQTVAASVDAKNLAMGQMSRDQRKEVTKAGRDARRASSSPSSSAGGDKFKGLSKDQLRAVAKEVGARAGSGDSKAKIASAIENRVNASGMADARMAKAAEMFSPANVSADQRNAAYADGKARQSAAVDKAIENARSGQSPSAPKPNARTQMMLSGDEVTEARQVAAGTKSRTVRKAAVKTKIAAADTMTGLKQLQGLGNKAMYGLAVATPAMFATSALVHGTMGWNRAKESGASNLQAAGSAAAGAAPAAVALAAPTIIGRTAPKLAAIVSKAALPLTALAAGIGAGVGAYKAYQRGASAGGILGGAALGAADTFTGGLASTAWTKWAGSGQGDATTLAITNHAASGARTASAQSGAATAGSQPPKLTADAAKRFNAAEKSYRSAQESSGAERQPAEKPEASGRKPGFGPEAIIASYYRRNPGGTNAPYGGDPTQAEGYTAPAAPKDKKS